MTTLSREATETVVHTRSSWDWRSWHTLLIAASVGALAVALYLQVRPHSFVYFSDFQNDYNAALAVRRSADPLAPAAAWIHSSSSANGTGAANVGGIYYTYAPIFAVLLVPFTALPVHTALVLWDTCTLLCLLGAVYACIRAAGKHLSIARVLVVATAISLIKIVRVELSLGQVDIFLMFLVCAAFWARQAGRPTLAGILLALACVTKPVLLPFAIYLLWKRDFRLFTTTIAAFAVLLLAPIVWLGGQTLRDQVEIWRYWSNEYTSFNGNYGPKGLLARLFTLNPYVHPLVVAPVLVTALWLVIIVVVAILTAAVVGPRPLRRDTRALMEFGLVAMAILLISPLTEYTYMIMLVIPLVACYLCLRELNWRSPPVLAPALGLLATWLLLCGIIERVSPTLVGADSVVSEFYSIATIYLYLLVAFFALHLRLMSLASGRLTGMALREFLVSAPRLACDWMFDARAALGDTLLRRRTMRQEVRL